MRYGQINVREKPADYGFVPTMQPYLRELFGSTGESV